jgi:hypothetical protein
MLGGLELLWDGEVIEGDASLGLDLSERVRIEVISCSDTVIQVADFRWRHSMIICYHISVDVWVFFVYQIQLWTLCIFKKLRLLLESSCWFQ